jgi:hypothetical protein
MVREACGGLSIKTVDPAAAPDATLIHCRRCNAVRGTLADRHDLARRSADVFEFLPSSNSSVFEFQRSVSADLRQVT